MGQVLLAESKREISEDAGHWQEDDGGDPENALAALKRLRKDARDNARDHARPDQDQCGAYPPIPVSGVEVETVEQGRHGEGGWLSGIPEGLPRCNPLPECVRGEIGPVW